MPSYPARPLEPCEVHAGFIRLTDCAPLVIAKEFGFDDAEGISLVLHREVSWANIRDKVEAGNYDCAIMLAPMPLAGTLGLGGRPREPLIAAMATSLNGNAITVSDALFDEMHAADPMAATAGGMAPARALARVVAARRARDDAPLTFGMVYPFSSHNYDLRYWLAAAQIDPDNDVNLVVVPPPLISDNLKAGRIDGFCVGEPWNSLAVAEGHGVIVATKAELWAASPEKVLGMRRAFAAAHPDVVKRLVRALVAACRWLDEPQNRYEAARVLARPEYVDVPEEILLRALTDTLERGANSSDRADHDVLIFGSNSANFPWVSHASWLLTQMIRWAQVRTPFNIDEVARSVYRSDIFRDAVSEIGLATPATDAKFEGDGRFFGDESFNPAAPIAYLERLALRSVSVDISKFAQAGK